MKIKPIALAVAIALGSANIAPVSATGFPVIDIAAVTESIRQYQQDLLNYAEYIKTTALEASQLDEAIQLYQQTMVSYNHMLRQMMALKNRISPAQWQQLYAKFQTIVERYPGSTPHYDTSWSAARDKQDKAYYQGNTQPEMEEQLQAIDYDSQSYAKALASVTRSRARADTGVNQELDVEQYDELTQAMTETLATLDDQRASLGDEDHIATLQLMADQQQTALRMQQQMLMQQNSSLKYANQLDKLVASKEQKGQEASIKAQQERMNETYEVNEERISDW